MSAQGDLCPPLAGENWQREMALADLAETAEFARELAQNLGPGDLLVLSGGLGTGKTTFTQALGEALGVQGQVSSPTFVLARIHRSRTDGPDLVHVDAYRTDAEGLESLDLAATMPESVTVVEWGRGLVEQALVGPEGSWLDLQLDSASPGGGHRSRSLPDVARTDDFVSARDPDVAAPLVRLAPDFTPEAGPGGGVSPPRGAEPSLEIRTDFSETDEDIEGAQRWAVLRGYGPRWAEPVHLRPEE